MEAQIVPKCFERVPRRPFGCTLDSPWELERALLGDLGAPGMLFGAPRELVGAPRELFGSSGGGFRSSRGRFWKHFGVIFEPFFCPCCACCGSQHLALFWSFLGCYGVHRSQSSQNGRDRSRLVNTNEIAIFSLTRELANISGTKPKQCWDELRIHMKILTKTGKIDS